MQSKASEYLGLITRSFDDKDVDTLIEHFRDPERRKEFFKEYKEIEMLYEIISPDAFLKSFIEYYSTLSVIYRIVRKAYTYHVKMDRDFQNKTHQLVQEKIRSYGIEQPDGLFEINAETIELIKQKSGGEASKVINLVKSIEKLADEGNNDPNLIAMAERARTIQEGFETRQASTAKVLEKLLKEIEKNETRKKEQAEKGLDGLSYFVYRILLNTGIGNTEAVSQKIQQAFTKFSYWESSSNAFRELRQEITFAIHAEVDDLDQVAAMADQLFTLLEKVGRI